MTVDYLDASPEQLLRAIELLPSEELDAFVNQVLTLRAQRFAPHLSQREADLLLIINRALPADLRRRFDDLIAKRRASTLTAHEHAELLHLTDQIESHDAERIAALADLARLRQLTLSELMHSLGIESPPYA